MEKWPMQEQELIPASKAEMLPLLVHASHAFRFRCMVDAKEEILKKGVISEEEYHACLKALLHDELSKAKILKKMELMAGKASLDEACLAMEGTGIPRDTVVACLFQLAVEGFLKCETPEQGKTFFSLVTTDPDVLKPIYVPVKVVDDGKACSRCSACQATCPVGC
nr:hypothetical protein [Candidatus Sigynarchaeota archaeon]